MPNEYLADNLVTEVRDNGYFPSGDADNDSIFRLLNREKDVYLMDVLAGAREEYAVAYSDITVTAGTTEYDIPGRATAAAVRSVEWRTDSGFHPMTPVSIDARYDSLLHGGGADYHFLGNKIVLLDSSKSGTMRVFYLRRLNKLVLSTEAAEVASFNAVAKTVTVVSPVPADWVATSTNYDFVKGTPHFDIRGVDNPATFSSLTFTFTNDLPTDLAVGDYIALAGQTPILNAPTEFHRLLASRATYRMLSSLGDGKANAAMKDFTDEEAAVKRLTYPRDRGEVRRAINYHAPGWDRVGRRRRRF